MFGRRSAARAAPQPPPVRRPENWAARRLNVLPVEERRVWRARPDGSWLRPQAAETVALWNKLVAKPPGSRSV